MATSFVAVFMLFPGCPSLLADEGHSVYVPLVFRTESTELQTTACLEVTEHVYSQTGWWENSLASATGPERALMGTLAAMRHNDRAALLRLTDPEEAKNVKGFDEQASAFFQQMKTLELLGIPRAYDVDGLAVFFVHLRSPQMAAYVPMIFAAESDGSFGFLPHRSKKVAYRIVQDWFNSASGPGKTDQPAYCKDDDLKRANYHVGLASTADPKVWRPTQLFLTGALFGSPGELGGLVTKVKTTVTEMKAALTKPGIDEFAKYMSTGGGTRLKQWYTTAQNDDRDQYKSAIGEQTPFFLFDLTSVVVVYTHTRTGNVQEMYFTYNAANTLAWTDASYITTADQVFKEGPLHDAASAEKPFSSLLK